MGYPILNPIEPDPLDDFSPKALKKALHNLQVHQVELEAQNTELQRIQAELDFERDRYFNLYNLAPVGYCTLNQNGFLSEANLTLLTLLKTDKKQITRNPFSRFVHPEDQDSFYKIRRQMLKLQPLPIGADGLPSADPGFEIRMLKSDGSTFWAHLTGLIRQGPGTRKMEIVFIIKDITARKVTEESLLHQTELLELTGEMAKLGGWELDLSTMRVTWSKETGRLHEVDENYQAPLLDTGENWYPPEAWPAVKAAVMAAIQYGTPYDIESPFITAKGRHIWVRIQGFPLIVNGKTTKLRGFFQDITERKLANLALEKSEQRLALALEGAGDGVWDWDIQTNQVYYSPQWEKLFGFEPGTVEQKLESMNPRLHPDDASSLFEKVDRYLKHEIPTYSHEARMFHKSGKILHTLHRGIAVFDQAGKPIRMFGTCVDITERKQAALDLEVAISIAKSASLSKTEFLTSMSHEIRTPLNGVLGLTQLLEETKLDVEQRDFVETIKSSGNLLLKLLNDILDFSKIENGKLDIESLPISVREILKEIIKSQSVATRTKGISLEEQISDQVPVWLLSDPSRLRQIIFNLIGNAIKFTNTGSITVKVDWKDQALRVEVTDTGLGIAPEKQELIFQRFSQADASTARKFGGSGLGLAISKRLVELMGGEIGLSSEVGQGSTFWFSIPMQATHENIAAQDDSLVLTAPVSDFSQVRILLVEDNLVNQKVAAGMLKKLGCSFDLAVNGLEALDKSMQTAYDLILMDCEMPEMDGYTATCEIRRLEALDLDLLGKPKTHRRIVALTANAMASDKLRCQACGMDGFLSKPFRKEELGQLIGSTFKGWS